MSWPCTGRKSPTRRMSSRTSLPHPTASRLRPRSRGGCGAVQSTLVDSDGNTVTETLPGAYRTVR